MEKPGNEIFLIFSLTKDFHAINHLVNIIIGAYNYKKTNVSSSYLFVIKN